MKERLSFSLGYRYQERKWTLVITRDDEEAGDRFYVELPITKEQREWFKDAGIVKGDGSPWSLLKKEEIDREAIKLPTTMRDDLWVKPEAISFVWESKSDPGSCHVSFIGNEKQYRIAESAYEVMKKLGYDVGLTLFSEAKRRHVVVRENLSLKKDLRGAEHRAAEAIGSFQRLVAKMIEEPGWLLRRAKDWGIDETETYLIPAFSDTLAIELSSDDSRQNEKDT